MSSEAGEWQPGDNSVPFDSLPIHYDRTLTSYRSSNKRNHAWNYVDQKWTTSSAGALLCCSTLWWQWVKVTAQSESSSNWSTVRALITHTTFKLVRIKADTATLFLYVWTGGYTVCHFVCVAMVTPFYLHLIKMPIPSWRLIVQRIREINFLYLTPAI